MAIPHAVSSPWPEVADGRFAASIRTLGHSAGDGSPGICIVGLPDDTGVALNHGRPGARNGPAAFRTALARLGSTFDLASHSELEIQVVDAGDIPPVEPQFETDHSMLDATHQRVTESLHAIHEMGLTPVCIGGGHDLTLPAVRGLAYHNHQPVAGINIDAHLDVRSEPGSGMPFRALIEGAYIEPAQFVEFGLGRFTCSREHVEWLEGQGGTIVDLESVLAPDTDFYGVVAGAFRHAFGNAGSGFCSFDLDVIDASAAPGVSAPNPFGLSPLHATLLAQQAGRTESIKHFDIMELNPDFDIDGRTARLAALIFLNFLAGYRERQ